MKKTLYFKNDKRIFRKIFRCLGLIIFISGFFFLIYIVYPLISWQLYFEPIFSSNKLQLPIPKSTLLTPDVIKSLYSNAVDSVNVDYANAQNWFPHYKSKLKYDNQNVTTYNISIPKLNIKYANVSTIDTDLSKHLVHYPGTAFPPDNGNVVIFGHSTLPNLFNPSDYKTIFAKIHNLVNGDKIIITINAQEFTYKIFSINITTPDDTTVFTQEIDNSYLTLITCTPPGTTWKRLIVKARKET